MYWSWKTTLTLTSIIIHRANADSGPPDCDTGPLASNGVCNQALPMVERAKALIANFTVEEKMANLVNGSPGVKRLGLPSYNWWNEALHGLAGSPGSSFASSGNYSWATSFPAVINTAATFYTNYARLIGSTASWEGRIFHNANRSGIDFWTPNINPFKDPRWGRGSETPGEDPRVIQAYTSAFIMGMYQIDSKSFHLALPTCKHYAAYDLEGVGSITRHNFDAKVTLQDLNEYYLPPFKTCVDSKVPAFMCSYNSVNGAPSCANKYLLQTILREHWGWNADHNWIVGDCDAVQDIWRRHKYITDPAQAAAAALKAGTDLDCGRDFAQYLPAAYNQSLITEADLDKALVRLYTSLVLAGYFEPRSKADPVVSRWQQASWAEMPNDIELARLIASDSIVLIKNDGILPLTSNRSSIALIGPWANATKQLQGNYAGPAKRLISPLFAAQEAGFNVTYALGSNTNSPASNESFNAALAAGQASDIIIFAGGIDRSIEDESRDRTSLSWPAPQVTLLRALKTLNKPIIVLQMGGGQVDSSEFLTGQTPVNALLWGGYPGQEGGYGIVDILTGKTSPSGRLPLTSYPASYAAAVNFTDMSLRPSATSPGRTHIWYKGTPVVPFGHGLHYTTFRVEWEFCDDYDEQGCIDGWYRDEFDIQQQLDKGYKRPWQWNDYLPDIELFNIGLRVWNTGKVESDYVTLLYVGIEAGPEPRPNRKLADFDRLWRTLENRPSRPANGLRVKLGDLARVEANGDRVLYPGRYSAWVDNDKKTLFKFRLTGKAAVLEKFPQP